MHKKSIVHVITKSRMKSEAFTAEIDAMEELSENYWIKNVIFYKGDTIEYKDLISKLEKFGILLYNYSNKEDLKEKVWELNKEFEVVFIYTPLELLINTVNELKVALWYAVSDHPNIFRDKYLQRCLIQEHNESLGIKFLEWMPEELNIEEIEEKIWYPFIIKPVDGVQSAWVAKVNEREDFLKYLESYNNLHDVLKDNGIDNKMLIVEEFIDGNLYSIDYFISSEWDITISKPLKVRLWIDIDVNDYCNIARIASEKTEWEFKGKKVKTFINSTVKATGIRNTFVHHEFKINTKGELKTIELNGRIWGWRLEVMKAAYDINLYEFIVKSDLKPLKLKTNNIAINIYATKKWLFKGFNNKLLATIKKRKTVYCVDKEESYVWKEIWLTKDGFKKVWIIKMESNSYNSIRKDYLYIKTKYKELLHINEHKKKGKKGILEKFSNIFKK